MQSKILVLLLQGYIEHDVYFWRRYVIEWFLGSNHCSNNVKQQCEAIKRFMAQNFLKLNADKTVFIPFSRSNSEFLPLQLDSNVSVCPSYSTRNLGVILDSKLSFKKHISELRRSSFFHLKRIKSVKPFIPHGMLETLVHAFVTSRVDWCNSLFFGLPDTTVSKIQTVDNACAKFLTGGK